jgi:hypothetical protein
MTPSDIFQTQTIRTLIPIPLAHHSRGNNSSTTKNSSNPTMQIHAMKLFWSVFAAFLLSPVPAQFEEFYCGFEPCIIPLRFSCEKMIEDYIFQGSCCSMETVNETLGCRLTVSARGNCFWYPKCGECDLMDDELQCNTIFSTDAESECPESEFDPVANSTASNSTNTTCPPDEEPTPVPSPTLSPASSGANAHHGIVYVVSAGLLFLVSFTA